MRPWRLCHRTTERLPIGAVGLGRCGFVVGYAVLSLC